MSAHPQLAASPDDIDYWTHSDWWPVWLVLERWGWPEPQRLEAKRQALLSACERGQVKWRRSDGKPYDDPIHELAARNRVLIERSSFMAWSRTLPERRRVVVPGLPSWAGALPAFPALQQPCAGLAVSHIAVVHSRTHAEVVERQVAANDPVPLVAEVATQALAPQDDLAACTPASSDPNPQDSTTSWSLVTQLQGSAAISSAPQHDYASHLSSAGSPPRTARPSRRWRPRRCRAGAARRGHRPGRRGKGCYRCCPRPCAGCVKRCGARPSGWAG